MIWEKLTILQKNLQNLLDENLEKYQEDDLERFNYGGWINLTWKSDKFRRAHIDVVDAREDKKLWMMHVCIFPVLDSGAPIYGFDIIAGEKKITGAFHDFSVVDEDHIAIHKFEEYVSKTAWKKERELPEWAKQIFSENMVAAGNLQTEEEVDQIISLVMETTRWYIEEMPTVNVCDYDASEIHDRYAHFQKQNPHTPRTMKSLGLNEEDVDHFVSKCLFPQIKVLDNQ